MDEREEKGSRADMSLSTGAKKAFSPSSVVEYARFPAKTWLREDLGTKKEDIWELRYLETGSHSCGL